ncbi:MAG: L-aspartate oxidase [Verrucomicrobia bacterium]|nr:MAG: L-aspartate oxidase [Verrucomicrobiota bacterium]
MQILDTDFLVIGGGLAGLTAALKLSTRGRVLVAMKKEMTESNTSYAQGGIACVMDPEDTFARHIQDTLVAGAGLCHRDVVAAIVTAGPPLIRELEKLGLAFERREGQWDEYDLGQEGGHTHRRVLHAGDFTGQEVIRVLLQRCAEQPRIALRSDLMAVDLAVIGTGADRRCPGAWFLDRATGELLGVRAKATVLATGGAGKVYLYTSNPDIATGDGVAMAWRAGLPILNMEFVQFHPTCLYHPAAKSFLISEAVRGEGGVLKTRDGASFMERYDPRGSLAPRDIVARAIDREMKTRGDDCVLLDITQRSAKFLRQRFPNIYQRCLEFGFNMAREPLPVVPAVHFFCGGVAAGVDGRTDLSGLYACGEVACTGLHGANRLASNSLLEALVCGHATGEAILAQDALADNNARPALPTWRAGGTATSDEGVVVSHNWDDIRATMWDYVGIVRTTSRLERALARVELMRKEVEQYFRSYRIYSDLLELRNIADVAALVIRSALQRQESRGLHYTRDYPLADEAHPPRDTRLQLKT